MTLSIPGILSITSYGYIFWPPFSKAVGGNPFGLARLEPSKVNEKAPKPKLELKRPVRIFIFPGK